MEFHVFNIGEPYTNAWWHELRSRGVITAGFYSEPGDRGDKILHDMAEGDWLIAYCNGHGYVGAGIVMPIDTYALHDEVLPGSQSSHRHERGVLWLHAVDDLAAAVPLAEVQQSAPRQTKERMRDAAVAGRIIALLEERSSDRQGAKYWHVIDAVRALGRPCSESDIKRWLSQHYPQEPNGDTRANATGLTVNDANRHHYDKYRKDFRSDNGNPRDALFRTNVGRNVFFEFYRPAAHGIWDLRSTDDRLFEAFRVQASEVELALAEAQRLVADEPVAPIESDEDARVRELRAVVVREGQGDFKDDLLKAYGEKCAMTDCAVVQILEAAHIKPYRGPETNRVDNGLLLRADIHTLFDKGLLWVDEHFLIQISNRLNGSEYAVLSGKPLRMPIDAPSRPHPDHLAAHRKAVLKR
ncbi:TPA: HNH endonuclease [Pseudomonas aeruginosa]|nr:HNH endonuclease [Pseudomonas aeruginosa]HBN9350681.1 HNH endonuclease [Pseudomonas aeruginosa]HCI2807274.1 HNH endonuclease [Pseudomonas aeruginosa]HCI4038878.1 HNH endonuclease [Pseudomonas aeruginosa]HEP9446726.1 HNH endonuclease [Pseudomonas aeruginosa]